MTDTISTKGSWFYTQGGQRKGPVRAEDLRALLTAQTIDGETPVWHKGLKDWLPLHQSEIGAMLPDAPPPVAAAQINNGLVWTLAVAPIAYLIIEVLIHAYQFSQPGDDFPMSSALIWIIPVATNCILCLLDEQQLKRAGYGFGWMTFFAVLLAPVYLFIRAQRLRQTPTYGYVWIASFIVSLLLQAS
ncbi:MAG: DUF4339 domain-containing protein [Rhizobiales bacterium]|nr:DUF4339 domain-containing protein [Hyphomicrobiales bacterium]MCW5684532.1 DUF4339 domain-containing protein [Pseudolabrys sp.]